MEIHVTSPGGLLIDAQMGDFKVSTDQPLADGGTNTAPSPFDLFLASLATCAGYYVMAFCRERNLPTEGIALTMNNDWNEKDHLAENITIHITLPDDFPEKYRRAVQKVAGMCTVKRHMEKSPAFSISVSNGQPD